ncbi:hypothetical protein BJX70DRAFT_396097 [Aspergillus crustosus]
MSLMKSLRAAFTRTRLDDGQKTQCANDLYQIFCRLRANECTELDDSHPPHSSNLYLCPLRYIDQNPLDMDDKDTLWMLDGYRSQWTTIHRKGAGRSEFICSMLDHHFSSFMRVDRDGKEVDALASEFGWFPCNCDEKVLLDNFEAFEHPESKNRLQPWIAEIRTVMDRTDGTPHILIFLVHASASDEKLLRVEILTMLGIMISRMKAKPFAEHIIIPVMVVSSFADCKARILQGFMTDTGPVIYNTGLYDFNDQENRDDHLQKCLGYMTSTPIGNTQQLNYRPARPVD